MAVDVLVVGENVMLLQFLLRMFGTTTMKTVIRSENENSFSAL